MDSELMRNCYLEQVEGLAGRHPKFTITQYGYFNIIGD